MTLPERQYNDLLARLRKNLLFSAGTWNKAAIRMPERAHLRR